MIKQYYDKYDEGFGLFIGPKKTRLRLLPKDVYFAWHLKIQEGSSPIRQRIPALAQGG